MLKKKLFNKSCEVEESKSELLDLSFQNCAPQDVSKYFPNLPQPTMNPVTVAMLGIQQKLSDKLSQINFINSPIRYVYDPTQYAKIPNELYYKKYCQSVKQVLFVGMNPGPFGMCQTGIPFGDTNRVKHWLQIEGVVFKPEVECPNRPVQGFDCPQKEQSGDRFWKFWADQCGTAEKFFEQAFVYNYCPLAFMDAAGRNVTPADLKDCKELEAICDQYYIDIINVLQPKIVVAIGRYIQRRSELALKTASINIPIYYLPHPSPRSVNNHNWPEKANAFLEANNLKRFFQ
ncbi:hypothetical protein ABEB36_003529 [Hypothenemus hampei]|uniref:Uracil-DNA glycosylase-like domain-containing protein n=1 Tax=Hypothenemus hampei TaxID=57062 RepID=A0ABD1F9G4_HYPHA